MGFEQTACPSGRFWKVQAGDTFYTIAERLNLDVGDLQRLNPGIDPHNLQVGISLCLPEELPPCTSGLYWRVAPGDTLFNIAQATGITLGRLLLLNPGIDPGNLRVDQAVCLPPISEISLKTQGIDKTFHKDS
ncbi:MAG: LysM peptidoglycan-binding domain-containing protein [Thermacetogeniaceae bacterium]